MNKRTIIAISIVLSVLLLIVGLYFINQRNTLKYKWSENYAYDSDQPYGTEFLYSMLGSYGEDFSIAVNEREPIDIFLREQDTSTIGTYLIIGHNTFYDSNDIVALKKFAKSGNTVFMALNEIPYDFLEMINRRCGYEYYNYYYARKKRISVELNNENLDSEKSYDFFYEKNGRKTQEGWNYFYENMCDSLLDYNELGSIRNGMTNFIRIEYGEGQILMHANPLMFTNRHMIREDGSEYMSRVFSYIPEGPIYFDKFSTLWSFRFREEGNEDKTPFTYILKQRSFKWAYYLLWVLVMFFVVFNLWRKQRPIPVKFLNKNSSLEFMQTIGELYFSAKNNRKLALQKMDHFLKWVRQKYYITERKEEDLIIKISKKTDIDNAQITAIFKQYHKIKDSQQEIDDSFLIGFYRNIEDIKKKSK